MKETVETVSPVIYENGQGFFSTQGNEERNGFAFRTGWKTSLLGPAKKKLIAEALNDPWVSKVYRRGNKIYKILQNGVEHTVA